MTGAGGRPSGQELLLGPVGQAVEARLRGWREGHLARRLLEKDPSIWADAPGQELADRLGWLDLPLEMPSQLAAIRAFGDEVAAEGVRRILLLGMGGSSLAPEVFQAVWGPVDGRPVLTVLDSTHPGAVAARLADHPPGESLYLVSSKSGTTVETLSFLETFWEAAGGDGRRFAAITDPGTALEALARERGFRRIFGAPPEVGGRFSALSTFGMVPAALLGADCAGMLESAAGARADLDAALTLGALLGEAARAGRDKLTLWTGAGLAALPAWIEQLVAESTGKQGVGIVPITGEPRFEPESYGPDRLFVGLFLADEDAEADLRRLEELGRAGHPLAIVLLPDRAALGAELFRWQVATAVAGAILGINPFDQPDVQLAKDLARRALAGAQLGGGEGEVVELADPRQLGEALAAWLAARGAGDYLAILAFLEPCAEVDAVLLRLRGSLASTGLPTTVAYGPRFLHSTGQLHKGGPDSGLFLQLLDRVDRDLAIGGGEETFGRLLGAQAAGDAAALRQRGRRLLRVRLPG